LQRITSKRIVKGGNNAKETNPTNRTKRCRSNAGSENQLLSALIKEKEPISVPGTGYQRLKKSMRIKRWNQKP
jgi:hypothetical protein